MRNQVASNQQNNTYRLSNKQLSNLNDDLLKLPQTKRQKTLDRLAMIRPYLDIDCLDVALKNYQGAVSKSTLRRWVLAYKNQGILGLAPQTKGRVASTCDWESDALALFHSSNTPNINAITRALNLSGHNCSYYQVRRYLSKLPAHLGIKGKARMGAKTYALTQTPYKIMDYADTGVGDVYQGDGHTVDVYIKHPNTGKPYRPELTAFIDVKSRYIVGWYLSEGESSISSIFALSHALVSQNHIPLMVHVDNGAGFKSKLMNHDQTGFYKNILGNHPRFSIPGRPTGKGIIERWFGTLKTQFHQLLPGFCGKARDAFDKSRWYQLALKGKSKDILSLENYHLNLKNYIEQYNTQPHKGLEGKTPADLWATVKRFALDIPSEALITQRTTRIVQRGQINFKKRIYRHPNLLAYNNNEVVIAYNLHSFEQVQILNPDGSLICEPSLASSTPYMAESALEEKKQNRLKGQIKRLDNKKRELEGRARDPIDTQLVEQLNAPKEIEKQPITIDITTTNY